MNRQQLANKIWAAANKMRSKIEANEYKDYILGFIFYRFLSEEIEQWLFANGYDEESIKEVIEEDTETVDWIRRNQGYFIGYNHLFSTWLAKGREFGIKDVTDALSAFNRHIDPTRERVFKDIFETLQTGLKNLGESDSSRSLAVSKLIQLIKDIPMDGKQGYDVLGYIYEYLISNFAASAGKKAGEFYTPHEVSELMAEIVAYHLRDREQVEVYDPTSGSGSLLITLGKAFTKHGKHPDNIKYYAQELIKNTYNLTRMNLVMRHINTQNIITRNGDTLASDWPYFESEKDRDATYHMIQMDAVVSNPPYSQEWNRPLDKEDDPRYSDYGLAPKKKADYAFLLHDLYHLKNDGIMTIVLPHGVLFRPGDEAEIRKNLIENRQIETIIGLPADIFFGTPIATIIMILKKRRNDSDVLFIDASKYASKDGKKKILRASDIRRIFEAVVNRPKEVEKFARLVSQKEIRDNEYDLNIPKYVDSSEPIEHWDFYSSMLGGVPQKEIALLNRYWEVMPELKSALFPEGEYVECKVDNIAETIANHADVAHFNALFNEAFADYSDYLKSQLIEGMETVNTARELDVLGDDLYRRLENVPLLDRYKAYQSLNDCWETTSQDLELIQTEGRKVICEIEPNMVVVKSGDEETEVQKGWRGRIMPFSLVQETLLPELVDKIKQLQSRLSSAASELSAIVDEAGEEDEKILNDDRDSIDPKKVDAALEDVLKDVTSPEIETLKEYLEIGAKKNKLAFIADNPQIKWSEMEAAKDGTYPKKSVNTYLNELRSGADFPEGTFEHHVLYASRLFAEQKELKTAIKAVQIELEEKTIFSINSLSEEQISLLLYLKWVKPIVDTLGDERAAVIESLTKDVTALVSKYAKTLHDIEQSISRAEQSLSRLIDKLDGSQLDKLALKTLQEILNHGK